MEFRLIINCDNAAFIDNPSELADILWSLANKVDGVDITDKDKAYMLKDSNGNRVGLAETLK